MTGFWMYLFEIMLRSFLDLVWVEINFERNFWFYKTDKRPLIK